MPAACNRGSHERRMVGRMGVIDAAACKGYWGFSPGDLAGRLAATLNKSLKGRMTDRLRLRDRFFCWWMSAMTKTRQWKSQTSLVHAGTLRSEFGETSEAMYLTQGYVYDSAESAEAHFKGEQPGFIYSRYSNPTVDMFEKRMCALEGAEDARATASGMAAVTAAMLCSARAGDHVVAARALFGSCRWVVETLAPKYGIEATLVDGT